MASWSSWFSWAARSSRMAPPASRAASAMEQGVPLSSSSESRRHRRCLLRRWLGLMLWLLQ